MQTTLYFREGGSDKVYHAAIEPVEGGYRVTFAFGRRGATLQTGTKTQTPVTKEAAEKIAGKLISEKLAKGYTIAEDGTPYRSSDDEGRDSGIRCQLLNPVDEDLVTSLLHDSRHLLQEKYDGKRMLVKKTGQEVSGINRRGLLVGLPESIDQAARQIAVDFVVDGEAVGDVLHAFDLLEIGGSDLRQEPYSERIAKLGRLLDGNGPIRTVRTFADPDDKRGEFERLREVGAEGVVFKDRDARSHPGRPASAGSQLKFKFVATATFIVGAINQRRSVSLILLDGTREVPAGNVTIPPNFAIPATGDIVEARYLYAFKESGAIYQPVFLGQRDDMERSDCQTSQLKFK